MGDSKSEDSDQEDETQTNEEESLPVVPPCNEDHFESESDSDDDHNA